MKRKVGKLSKIILISICMAMLLFVAILSCNFSLHKNANQNNVAVAEVLTEITPTTVTGNVMDKMHWNAESRTLTLSGAIYDGEVKINGFSEEVTVSLADKTSTALTRFKAVMTNATLKIVGNGTLICNDGVIIDRLGENSASGGYGNLQFGTGDDYPVLKTYANRKETDAADKALFAFYIVSPSSSAGAVFKSGSVTAVSGKTEGLSAGICSWNYGFTFLATGAERLDINAETLGDSAKSAAMGIFSSIGELKLETSTSTKITPTSAELEIPNCKINMKRGGAAAHFCATSVNETVAKATAVTFANLEKRGYILQGYSTTENGSVDYPVHSQLSIANPEKDLTYYPVWTPISYTIRFDPNGGNYYIDSIMAIYDVSQNLPTYTGRNQFCVIEIYDGTESQSYSVYSDFLHWVYGDQQIANADQVLNLTDQNEGEVVLLAQYKDFAEFPLPSLTKPGYTLLGYSDTLGGPMTMSVGDIVRINTFGETKKFYPVWALKSYTIAFDRGDGEGEMESVTVKYGESFTLPKAQFKMPIGQLAIIKNNGEPSIEERIYSDFFFWSFDGREFDDEAVVSNLTETSGATVTLTANYEYTKTVVLPTLTKSGYIFKGFATEESGKVKFKGGAQVIFSMFPTTDTPAQTQTSSTMETPSTSEPTVETYSSLTLYGIFEYDYADFVPIPLPTVKPTPTPTPTEPVDPIDPNPIDPTFPTLEESIEKNVSENEDGTFDVKGKYADGGTYPTLEEAKKAAAENYQKELGEKKVDDFVNDNLKDLPGEEIDAEKEFKEEIEKIEKTDDGKFIVDGKKYQSIEEAVAAVEKKVKTEIFENKQVEISGIVSGQIHFCDGKIVNNIAKAGAKDVENLDFDASSKLKAVYEKAMDSVSVAKNAQKLLAEIQEMKKTVTKQGNFTSASQKEFDETTNKLIKSLQRVKSNEEVWTARRKFELALSSMLLKSVSFERNGETLATVLSSDGLEQGTKINISFLRDIEEMQKKIDAALQLDGILSDEGLLAQEITNRLMADRKLKAVVDISLDFEEVTETENGKYKVRLKVPPELVGFGQISIVHEHDGVLTYIRARIVDGYVEFETPDFSSFAIYAKEPGDLRYMAIPLFVLAVLIATYIVVSKRKEK